MDSWTNSCSEGSEWQGEGEQDEVLFIHCSHADAFQKHFFFHYFHAIHITIINFLLQQTLNTSHEPLQYIHATLCKVGIKTRLFSALRLEGVGHMCAVHRGNLHIFHNLRSLVFLQRVCIDIPVHRGGHWGEQQLFHWTYVSSKLVDLRHMSRSWQAGLDVPPFLRHHVMSSNKFCFVGACL